MPLYPDAQDTPRKRVLIIVDSGPGRIDLDMLETLRARGFYLMAGVPNTTHVNQATYRNYGPFKTIYIINLKETTRQSQASHNTIKVNGTPLLVFGCGGYGLRNTFEETFGVSNNIAVWKEIGINTFNRNCLKDNKVKHEILILEDGTIDVDAHPLTEKLLKINRENIDCIEFLNEVGFDGSQFFHHLPVLDLTKEGNRISVTAPLSPARQDSLSKANTAGKIHAVAAGDPLNNNYHLIYSERTLRTEQKAILVVHKNTWAGYMKVCRDAEDILYKLEDEGKDGMLEENENHLRVDHLRVLYKWIHEKPIPLGTNRP